MQAADPNFTLGLRLLLAARRNENWTGDVTTEAALQRLASSYRIRGTELMAGGGCVGAQTPLLRKRTETEASASFREERP